MTAAHFQSMTASQIREVKQLAAVAFGAGVGYQRGLSGSLTPDTLKGVNVDLLATTGVVNNMELELGAVVGAAFFRRMEIFDSTVPTTYTFLASAATFTNPPGSKSRWAWGMSTALVTGRSYTVTFFA